MDIKISKEEIIPPNFREIDCCWNCKFIRKEVEDYGWCEKYYWYPEWRRNYETEEGKRENPCVNPYNICDEYKRLAKK